MNKPQIRQTGLLAFAIVALLSSSAFAAPQDDVFKRPTDKKAESPEAESSTTKAAEQKTTTSSSLKKESSAKITEQSDGWFTVVDDASNTEVRLPGNPKYLERSFSPIAGREAVVNHRYVVYPNKESSFEFSWMDLHEAPTTMKQLNESLEGAVKGSVVNVLGQLVQMEKIPGGVNGREYEFTFSVANPKDKKDYVFSGRSRVFIKGNRRYQLDAIAIQGKEDAEATKQLFDSLIIKSE